MASAGARRQMRRQQVLGARRPRQRRDFLSTLSFERQLLVHFLDALSVVQSAVTAHWLMLDVVGPQRRLLHPAPLQWQLVGRSW
jgi:hypothetical protein